MEMKAKVHSPSTILIERRVVVLLIMVNLDMGLLVCDSSPKKKSWQEALRRCLIYNTILPSTRR